MDELGAAFRRVSKLLDRQGVNAPAASVSRFEKRHPFARARKLASSHETRGTRADNQETARIHRIHQSRARQTKEDRDELADYGLTSLR